MSSILQTTSITLWRDSDSKGVRSLTILLITSISFITFIQKVITHNNNTFNKYFKLIVNELRVFCAYKGAILNEVTRQRS